ncbi:MAG TPA: glycosyltransferase family 4 protein [Planctomicrobium sp.]|nr:glycosyltransferase family 4 protein [Planctomicrobium sp.]
MRLGVLFEYGTLNGGEQSILAVLSHLSGQIPTPVILAPATGPLATACSELKLNHVPFELNALPVDPEQRAAVLNALCDEHQLDLLHANSLSAGRKIGGIAPQLNCATSSHLRDIMKLSQSAVADLSRHQGLIAVSHATRDFHQQQGVNSELFSVIHNGIDTGRYFPCPPTGQLHRELGLDAKTPLAAVVGQICLRKGHHDMAHAAVLLKDQVPDLHFVIVGERHSTKNESVEFDEHLTALFVQAGIGDRLHRLGWRHDLQEIYREFRLLVHAARQEPLGRVLLEAAACGVPIVATRVGGTEEILTHLDSAWLVSPADPNGLAEGIAELMKNPACSRQFAESARRTIEERFTIEQAARCHLEFWEHRLLRRSGGF